MKVKHSGNKAKHHSSNNVTVKDKTKLAYRKDTERLNSNSNSRLFQLGIVAVFLSVLACVAFRGIPQLRKTKENPVVYTSAPAIAAPLDGGWGRANSDDERMYNSTVCNIERRFAEDVSKEEFEKEFRFKKPLIVRFRNGAAGWTDPGRWTKQSLVRQYGRWSVRSGTSSNIVRRGGNGDTQTSFKEYLEFMNDDELKKEPMYIFDRSFYNSSELPKTIKPPSYLEIKDGVDSSIFFLGGSRSGVSFHKHADAWNGVIYGRKRWFLYSAERTPPGGVWPSFSQQDWFRRVYPHLKSDLMPMECIQEAGEIMYLPEAYYHGTINIGDTIAIGIQKNHAITKVEGLFYEAMALGERGTIDVKFNRIERIYRELTAILPGSTEVLHKLATTLFEKGNLREAIEIMTKVVSLDPWFVIAKVDLSKYYAKGGNNKKALKLVEEALKTYPDSVDGNWQHANLLKAMGEFSRAVKIYLKLIQSLPSEPSLFFHMAYAMENSGDFEGAAQARDQGVKIKRALEEQQRY